MQNNEAINNPTIIKACPFCGKVPELRRKYWYDRGGDFTHGALNA